MMFTGLLVINAIWFTMAFYTFSIKHRNFAKVVTPRDQRNHHLFDVLAESGRFLGGMNFAFALCNIMLLLNLDLFPSDAQRAFLLFIFGIAHGSQFIFNVPVALENRKGGGVWQVFKMPMLFIFVTDFVTMALNLAGSALLIL
ncbi:hypothetical protein [Litoribrevibacter albus]|uniref:Uncharacterized protein n=1 Tax=Litoribrevibacter albus TaxID=1473156 RepID=A0AA37S791_9GAMM|nr:hypothetical protein [Litoribrevibacter albus]GLQ30405.1 hypothetical protein GCM10007876_08830 [Litoribrevibacter albus]